MERLFQADLLLLYVAFAATTVSCLVLSEENADTRLNALEYMLVEEKQLRATLETKVDNLQNAFNTIDASIKECGCSNAQKQPEIAFFATFASANGLDCQYHQPIIFDNVKLNSGTGYNPNHGVFTAPVSGLYTFQSSLSAPPQSKYHVTIVQNVTSNEIGYLFLDSTSIWTKRTTSAITHLGAGEDVWMVCIGDSHIQGHSGHSWEGAGDFHSHFSGFLISQD